MKRLLVILVVPWLSLRLKLMLLQRLLLSVLLHVPVPRDLEEVLQPPYIPAPASPPHHSAPRVLRHYALTADVSVEMSVEILSHPTAGQKSWKRKNFFSEDLTVFVSHGCPPNFDDTQSGGSRTGPPGVTTPLELTTH
jgi:hypothetical protein